MSLLHSTKELLGIKDLNITLLDKKPTYGIRAGTISQEIYGILTYHPDACPHCGNIHEPIIKYGFRTSKIALLSCAGQPLVLILKKQRFFCKACESVFIAQTPLVDKHCNISKPLKTKIAIDLTEKISEKELAKRHFVSHNTVSRIVDSAFSTFYPRYNSLPKHMAFDEFKSTKSCKGKMSFIYMDAQTHEILDIVENRQLPELIKYFSHFTKQSRARVETISIDIYQPYISLIKQMFPNAKIVFDRFHIVQLFTRALIKTRIKVMKQFSKHSKEYKRLKRYWRLIQTNSDKVNSSIFRKRPYFSNWVTDWEIVASSISVDRTLEEAYIAYQHFRKAVEDKRPDLLYRYLIRYKNSESEYLKTCCNTLLDNWEYVENALKDDISNGPLEGINNFIKVIKRVAFGFRSFHHFRNRILICKKLILPKNYEAAIIA